MSQKHLCPCTARCNLQRAMDSIGGKWKLPILCSLTANGTSRYNDLLRNVHGISNTMLSKTLKELEESGLVRRAEYLEVPVYRLHHLYLLLLFLYLYHYNTSNHP